MQRSWVRISSLISGVKRTWFHCRICRRSRPASGPGKPPCPCSCRRKPASCCSSHSSSFVVGPAGSASLPVRDIRSDLIHQRMIRSIRRPATRGKSGVGSSCQRNSQFRKSLLPAVNFNLGSLWLILSWSLCGIFKSSEVFFKDKAIREGRSATHSGISFKFLLFGIRVTELYSKILVTWDFVI